MRQISIKIKMLMAPESLPTLTCTGSSLYLKNNLNDMRQTWQACPYFSLANEIARIEKKWKPVSVDSKTCFSPKSFSVLVLFTIQGFPNFQYFFWYVFFPSTK